MSTLRVTIRDGACIEYLRDRKKRGFPFSLSVTDVLIEHLEDRANKRRQHIIVNMTKEGTFTTRPEGALTASGQPVMQALLTELKTVFEGAKKKRKSE